MAESPTPSSPPLATTSRPGLESAADKAKLDGIAAGAAALSDDTPEDIGTADEGTSSEGSRSDHVHAHGNQASSGTMHAAATQSVAGFLSAADKTTLDRLYPTWDAATEFGVFALDYDAGSDSNAGFSSSSTLATACAAAGLIAKKTWSGTNGLLSVLPKVGRGHKMVIMIKNRAASGLAAQTYLKDDALTADNLYFTGFPGFSRIDIVGTSDFSDSAQDRINSGAITVSATFTVTATGTTSSATVGGGGLPTEANGVLRRIKWTGGTAANLNKAYGIYSITGNVVVPCQNFGGAPQNGDTFVIEDVGVQFGNVKLDPRSPTYLRGIRSAPTGLFAVWGGIDTSGATGGQNVALTFCAGGTGSGAFFGLRVLVMGATYIAGSSFDVLGSGFGSNAALGFGFRWGSAPFVEHIERWSADCSGNPSNTGAAIITTIAYGAVGSGCVFLGAAALSFFFCGVTAPILTSQFDPAFTIGGITTNVRFMRVDGRMVISDCACQFNGGVITQAVAGGDNAALSLRGFGSVVKLLNLSGSTGNIGFGIALLAGNAALFRVTVDSTVTLTGTSGDIKVTDVSSNVITTTYSALAITNFVDDRGNEFLNTTIARVVSQGMVFTNGDGTSHAVGEVVRVSATDTVVRAQNDTPTHAAGSLFVAVTPPAAGAKGIYVPMAAPQKWVLHDAAPTLNGLSYISGTAGSNSTTVPSQGSGPVTKRRCGTVTRVSGSLGLVVGTVENLGVEADGEI